VSLPKTPIKGDAETRRFLEAVRQQVDSTTNNALTLNDLRSNGFFANNGIDVGGNDDVAPPTTPTNLQASGAFESIIITWGFADYVGHSNSRIYRSLTNVFANAEVLANVDGRVYGDVVGGNKTYYYWVSNVNVNNIESATSQANGVQAVTLPNTQALLNALTTAITSSQLNNALGARINLIDGIDTLVGSVNARLKALDTEITTELNQYTNDQISASSTSLTNTFNNTLNSYVTTATLTNNYYTAAGTNSAIATANSTLTANFNSTLGGYVTTATLTNNYYTAASTNSAISAANSTLSSNFTSQLGSYVTTATLTNNYFTGTTTNAAIASSVGQVSARLNNFNGSSGVTVEQSYTAEASKVTGLQGQYTVKIDNNGYVSGFGLASTAVNGTPFSDFIVRADRFAISSPSGPAIAPVTPFIVTTATSVIDGVSIPAGVYIKSATILDGAITNAKIKDAAIDDAKIASLSAAKITTGSLDAARVTIDGVTLDTYYDASIARNRLRIRDLGVGTAKIENAAISTLKIAGNAVTLPLVYTAADINVTSTITVGSGTNCVTTYVGANLGDWELNYFTYQLYYVGANLGSYTYVCTAGSGVTGGQDVIETAFITVGDNAASGGLIVVFYATLDATQFIDSAQKIALLIDTGSGYTLSRQTTVGTVTNNGNTYASLPIAIATSINGVTSARFKVVTGKFQIPNAGTNNSSYMRNTTLSVLGAKR